MPLGKEVADAYIDVHGDLNPFRRDLDGAEGIAGDAGGEAGDEFAQAFEDKARRGLNKRWDAITEALYSGKGIDWDRALGEFDPSSLSDAHDKVTEFFADMERLGAMNEDQWAQSQAALNKVIRLRNEEFNLDRLKIDNLESQEAAFKRLATQVAETENFQKRFNKSFESMFTGNQLADMEADFRKLTRAMNDMDFSKLAKGEQDLGRWSERMQDTVRHMNEFGRISDANAAKVTATVREFVTGEQQRRDSIASSKAEMDAFKDSFTDFAQRAKSAALHKDFQLLAEAVASGNWSKFASNYKTVDAMDKRIKTLLTSTRELGEVTDVEADRISRAFSGMQRSQRAHGVELERSAGLVKALEFVVRRVQTAWQRTDSTVRLVTTLIAAAAGPVAALASGLAGAGTALVSSLALAAGSIVPIVTGLGAVGLAVALAISSIDGIKEAFPRIQTSVDRMSQAWADSAKAFGVAWGPALDEFLDRFATVALTSRSFGTQFGEAAAVVTRAFTDIVNGPGFNALMDAVETTLPAAVQGFGVGFAGVMSSIVSLMAGAAPVAQALGEDFARWGTNLAAALERGRESGRMTEVFERMRESLLAVLDFIGSVGSALGTLFMLGSTSGNSMLRSLTGLVDKFNEWMQTAEGATAVSEWFRDAEAIMRSLAPLAAGLGKALGMLVNPQSIGHLMELSEQLGNLLPKIAGILDAVSQSGLLNIFADALGAIADGVQPLLGPLGELGRNAGPALQGVFQALGPLLAGVASVLAPVVEGFAEMSRVVGPLLGPAIERIATALAPVMQILGDFVGMVSGLIVPVLQFLATTVIEAVVGAVEGLSDVFTGVVDLITSLFSGDLPGAFDALVQIVTGAFTAVWNIAQLMLYTKFLSVVKTALSHIPGLFSKAFSGIKGFVNDGLAALPGLITTFFSSLPGQITALAVGLGTALYQGFVTFGPVVAEFFAGVWEAVVTTVSGWGASLAALLAPIGTFFAELWTGITTNAALVWATLTTTLSTLWTGIVTTATTIWTSIVTFFTGVWASIQAAFTTGTTGVTTAASGLWTNIQAIFAAGAAVLQAAWSAIWSVIGQPVMAFVAWITPFLTGWWTTLSTVFQSGMTLVTSIFTLGWTIITTAVQTAWTVITTIFTTGWTIITTAMQAGWTVLQSVFTLGWTVITTAVQTGWTVLSTIFTTGWSIITSAAQAGWAVVQSVFTLGMTVIQTAVQAGWTVIQTVFTTVWTTIQTIVQTGWTAIQMLFTSAMAVISTAVSAGWAVITTIFTAVWETLKAIVAAAFLAVVALFTGNFSLLLATVQGFWSTVSGIWSSALTAITTILAGAWNSIKAISSSTFSALGSLISGAWNSIRSTFSSALSAIQSTLAGAWNAVRSASASTWSAIQSLLSSAWTAIRSTITSAASAILSTISNAWNSVRSATSSAMSNILSAVSSAWTSIRSTISSASSAVLSAIQNAWNSVVSATQSAFQRALSAVTTALSSIQSAVSSGISTVLGFFQALPGRVAGALSGFAGEMRSVGTNIIQGLMDGITAMAGNVIEAATGVVSGAISAAKGLLGIKSPSRVFAKIGHQTGEGLALGLEDMRSAVKKAAIKMTDEAILPFDASKMYVAGKDAALGLADGLASQNGLLDATMRGLSADLNTVKPNVPVVARMNRQSPDTSQQPQAKQLTLMPGAITVNTPASDGRLVANQMLDALITDNSIL